MKLNIVPARTGIEWVKLGVKTFFSQPLAMAGLFFMFMAAVSLLSLLPLIGAAVSLALVPAATLGLMAASREAAAGRFPMPITLITAFRSGPQATRAMLMLGALYASAMLLVLALAALLGSGASPVAPADTQATPEQLRQAILGSGMWAALLLYVPLLMAFWHAPALVHWHGISPGKSLFFSLLACWRNKWAMLFYALGWVGVFMLGGLLISLLGALLGGARVLGFILYPAVLLMAAMFHTSIYFTFRDSFLPDDAPALPTAAPNTSL